MSHLPLPNATEYAYIAQFLGRMSCDSERTRRSSSAACQRYSYDFRSSATLVWGSERAWSPTSLSSYDGCIEATRTASKRRRPRAVQFWRPRFDPGLGRISYAI